MKGSALLLLCAIALVVGDNQRYRRNACPNVSDEHQIYPHENCNKFYLCANGNPVVFSCHSILVYNPITENCDWPENVDCEDRSIPTPEPDNGNSCESNNGDNDNDDPSKAPIICAAEGSDGTLIANENCNKFYICSNGVPESMSCQKELLYNPAKEQCDWPENVKCGNRIIPNPEGGSGNGGDNNNGGEDNNGSGGNGGNSNPSEAPALCKKEGSDGVLVAHENCNQFYVCSEGAPVALSCQSGLLYNPAKEQCDWPDNVKCGNRVIPNPEGGSGNGGDNNNGGEDNNGSGGNGGNSNPSEAPALCKKEGSDGVLVAHENCNQFYVCSEGAPVALSCQSGLLYNPAKEQCDWPGNVKCGNRVIPNPEGGSGNGGDNNNGGEDNNGSGGNGGNSNPSEAPALCGKEGSDGVLVAHENCNQFYVCSEGAPLALSCQSGLLYNPAKEQCDWPENVKCGNRVIPNPEGGSGNGGDNNNGGENNNGSGGNGGNSNPSEAPALCKKEGSDGVLVAHENCNQFYVCSEGAPVALSCQSGLLYNPAKEQCDWPYNVQCGNRIIS